ncbi:unnamed protein product, partial [Mesorhabditis spiculigera]
MNNELLEIYASCTGPEDVIEKQKEYLERIDREHEEERNRPMDLPPSESQDSQNAVIGSELEFTIKEEKLESQCSLERLNRILVLWDSELRGHRAPHAANEPATLLHRSSRRKRCSCGCSNCDQFPNRPCCSAECCGTKPLPLACCPPPPPPKPCCQPAYGPCCPSTPNCCPRPCCQGKRPPFLEDEEDYDEPGGNPQQPSLPSSVATICRHLGKADADARMAIADAANPVVTTKIRRAVPRVSPCCPPILPLPKLPCCLKPSTPQCCTAAPPCLRACPGCPCRKRVMLGKRAKRGAHCMACAAVNGLTAPRAGGLYERSRASRIRRDAGGCAQCVNGEPVTQRVKRTACQPCTYLQPQYSENNPFLPGGPQLMSQVGRPLKRSKREEGKCLPHPQCTLAPKRRSRRNVHSQYCEPCGGLYGRRKREAEQDACIRRNLEQKDRCEKQFHDEFDAEDGEGSVLMRMKRQAYDGKGLLDLVKVMSKAAAAPTVTAGCVKFPACVLAQKRRRKRHAERMEQYHKALAEHKEQHSRVKRQFFTPDQSANCVPCPAWVTMALASRKKRGAAENDEDLVDGPKMSLSDAIKDIRRKKGYEPGFKHGTRSGGHCDQTHDCLNEVEYAVYMKVYHTRTKRSAKRSKCTQCGTSDLLSKRVKRSFGPDVNASEHDCLAFPLCRNRVKRNFIDCNICTATPNRRKRTVETEDLVELLPMPAGLITGISTIP